MKLIDITIQLAKKPNLAIQFQLPDGQAIAQHAHITEVARIDKKFIDCGGTLRSDSLCRLQTWVGEDVDHRLTAGKLLGILNKATGLLQVEDLEVDIEHEQTAISQYPVIGLTGGTEHWLFELGTRHTDCLAKERCIAPSSIYRDLVFKPRPSFL